MVPAPREAAPPAAEQPAPATEEPAPATVPPPPIYTRPAPAPRLTAPATMVPRVRQGHLFMPFLGVHSFQDSGDSGLDPGLRVGTFLGSFVTNDLSVNGALTFDIANPNERAAPLHVGAQMLEASFSPFLHMGSPQVEFILGPKLGLWNMWTQLTIPAGVLGPTAVSGDATTQGWTIGANMGLLVAPSPAALVGVIFSLEVRDVLHSCGTLSGMAEECQSSGDSTTLLGFSLAVLL
jgi:hypothetical protein